MNVNREKQKHIEDIIEHVERFYFSKKRGERKRTILPSDFLDAEMKLREAIRYHKKHPTDTILSEEFKELHEEVIRRVHKVFDERKIKIENFETGITGGTDLSNEEIDFLLETSGSEYGIEKFDRAKVQKDIGLLELTDMIAEFRKNHLEDDKFMGPLNHFGVNSRWKNYLRFLLTLQQQQKENLSSKDIFISFAKYLGRVVTYRALSLDKQGYDRIMNEKTILCTGRLSNSNQVVKHKISRDGIMKICYDRLYMRHAIDPSLSVHDDAETTVCIASNFLMYGNKKKYVYLFELNLPMIETIGFTVYDVQFHKKEWFLYSDVYFDSRLFTTERYMLNEIPFFSLSGRGRRLVSVRKFKDAKEIKLFLAPFIKKQKEIHDRDTQ